MTKAQNRTAARAYAADQDAKRRQLAHAEAVKGDLEQLEALRRYLIAGWRSGPRPQALIEALDECAEQLTGDRTALHAKSAPIG